MVYLPNDPNKRKKGELTFQPYPGENTGYDYTTLSDLGAPENSVLKDSQPNNTVQTTAAQTGSAKNLIQPTSTTQNSGTQNTASQQSPQIMESTAEQPKGLISTRIDPDNPLGSVAGFEAEKVSLDPSTDTVEGRVASLIEKNSPLAKSAETRSLQQANKRGLLNSSIAVGAGQRALYDYAMPIASQDAATSFKAKMQNQDAVNQARAQTAGAQTAGSLQERAGQQSLEQIGASGEQQRLSQENQAELQKVRDEILQEYTLDRDRALNADVLERDELLAEAQAKRDERLAEIERERDELLQEQNLELQGARSDQAKELAVLENEYGTLRQSTQTAGALLSQFSNSISQILSNPDIPRDQKQGLVDKQLALMKTGLNVLGGLNNLDLTGLLYTNDGGGENSGGGPFSNFESITGDQGAFNDLDDQISTTLTTMSEYAKADDASTIFGVPVEAEKLNNFLTERKEVSDNLRDPPASPEVEEIDARIQDQWDEVLKFAVAARKPKYVEPTIQEIRTLRLLEQRRDELQRAALSGEPPPQQPQPVK